MPVIGLSVRSARINGMYRDQAGHTPTVSRAVVRSVAYDSAIAEVVRHLCVDVGVGLHAVDEVIVGASHASLQPSRLRRRTPAGPYWRDILTTALEFRLGTRVTVHSAIELAARAELCRGAGSASTSFVLIQAGPETEVGLIVDGTLRAATFHDARPVTGALPGRLARAILPLLRTARPDLIVVGGTSPGRGGSALCAALRLALFTEGVRPPRIVPTGIAGDAVLVGAHAAAYAGRK